VTAPARPESPLERLRQFRLIGRVEDGVIVFVLAAMVVMPVLEIVTRRIGPLRDAIPSTILVVQYLTLWLALLGAALAAREGRHIAMAPIADKLKGAWRAIAQVVAGVAGGAVSGALALAGWEFASSLRESPIKIGGVPEWVWALALPLGFAVVAVRLGLTRVHGGWKTRLAAAAGCAAVGLLFALLDEEQRSGMVWPGIIALVVATLLGGPLFALLGGAALLLFVGDWSPIATVSNETFGLVTSPILPSIPLFTLAGYVFAEGGASRRLVRMYNSLFGWMPGGLAIAATLVCAFFTAFTGGSGVTILALGGLLLPALVQAGYRERYSVGLLTSAGSLGLLFPPSVPVILYGVVSGTPIGDLFAGAFIPGMVLMLAVAATGVFASVRAGIGWKRFELREALAATWEGKWELLLPAIVLGGLFGGFTTPVEAAALTAFYAILVETVIHRELGIGKDMPTVLVKTATLIGGVLTILGVARGFAYYLVDAQVTELAADWARENIEGRIAFLLALNVFLLLIGCLMDIFSAIVVVVPIIRPMAEIYGIDPIHLGVIFIANLELGYLTPPVGLNLFLSAFRFEKPLVDVYRSTVAFFVILLLVVLLITYVPSLTHVGLALFGRTGGAG